MEKEDQFTKGILSFKKNKKNKLKDASLRKRLETGLTELGIPYEVRVEKFGDDSFDMFRVNSKHYQKAIELVKELNK